MSATVRTTGSRTPSRLTEADCRVADSAALAQALEAYAARRRTDEI